MGISTFILGNSGAGKSTSLRNLNPDKVMLIRPINKPLPFRHTNWKKYDKDTKTGSIITTENYDVVKKAILHAHTIGKEIIIIDDWNYYMSGEFMRRAGEKGYDKYSEMGHNYWSVINTANENTPDNMRIYFISHLEEDSNGFKQVKTIGKMVSEKIVPEGMVSIVLGAERFDNKYNFITQTDGRSTFKSPIGMFADYRIDNDLEYVDNAICEYYGITPQSK